MKFVEASHFLVELVRWRNPAREFRLDELITLKSIQGHNETDKVNETRLFTISHFRNLHLSLFILPHFESETLKTRILKHLVLCLICLIFQKQTDRSASIAGENTQNLLYYLHSPVTE